MAERERDMWVSWHTAFLHRVDAKHFPPLNELITKLRPKLTGKASSGGDGRPPRQDVARDLMNALLQLPAAPKETPTPTVEQDIQENGDRTGSPSSDPD